MLFKLVFFLFQQLNILLQSPTQIYFPSNFRTFPCILPTQNGILYLRVCKVLRGIASEALRAIFRTLKTADQPSVTKSPHQQYHLDHRYFWRRRAAKRKSHSCFKSRQNSYILIFTPLQVICRQINNSECKSLSLGRIRLHIDYFLDANPRDLMAMPLLYGVYLMKVGFSPRSA